MVIQFMLTFLLVYVTSTVIYKYYLQYSVGSNFYPDYVTNLVAKQTESILTSLGYETKVMPHPKERSMKLFVNGNYLARIIEGCNAVSIIILFFSFVFAFSGKLKTTFFYVLSGSVLIYIVNLLRIVVLSLGLCYYPEKSKILHSVIFPGIIYGMVFLLWFFWVHRFSKLNTKDV